MARHLITLIGRRINTALIGVKEFHPDVLHLIYTDVTADIYQPFLKMLDPRIEVVEYNVDPYDVNAVMRICGSIRENLGSGDILQYNLTEGTKVEALAALAAAREYGGTAVYYSQEGEAIDLTDFSRSPIQARVSNEEFFALSGNEVVAFNKASDLLPIDVVTAYEVKTFIEKNQKTYQRIQKQYRAEFGGRVENLPASFKVDRERGMYVYVQDGKLAIVDRGKSIFASDNPYASRLFFSGRWWEVIVSDKVYKWDRARRNNPDDSQVWRNVELSGIEKGKTKNELDVLVNDRRRLILIECKSGYIAQENIYKTDSVRETYGGVSSKAVLVSYYPLDPDLIQKCKDLHVYWYAPERASERISFIHGLPAWLDMIVKDIER